MEANKWISVKNKLPEREKYVLVQDVLGAIYIGKLWSPENYPTLFVSASSNSITTGVAWQPLPESYKEEV